MALYLHQALFTNETAPPPAAHRPVRGYQGRQLPSFSSVTLHTASESSHASASLVEAFAESPAYQELLSRQPLHPSEATGLTELTFHGDPITDSERRRRRWEIAVVRRLRCLKWARRLLTVVVGGWAVYNATRYFVAFAMYSSHKRQVSSLALGTVALLAFACVFTSQLLSVFAPRFGWNVGSKPRYTRVRSSLDYAASLFLLGPATANLVLVFLWRRSSDSSTAIEGSCHWDIDVTWSGVGRPCNGRHVVSWGSWVAGSVVRLVLTALVLTAYHYVCVKYTTTRRPSRRGRGRTHLHSISYASSGEAFLSAPSVRSSMVSTATGPVSVARTSRQPSRTTSESDFSRETHSGSSSSDHPILRRPASRTFTEPIAPGESRARSGRVSFTTRSQPSASGHASHTEEIGQNSPRTSEEELSSVSDHDPAGFVQYGRLPQRNSGTYTVIPPSALALEHLAEPTSAAEAGHNTLMSLDRFRDLLEEITRETQEVIQLAQHDPTDLYLDEELLHSRSYETYLEDDEDADFIPVVGRMIQRMPTIESLGSREIMSLSSAQRGEQSIYTLSRPPTRSNTLTLSEAAGSRPISRSNSLTASVALSPALDGQPSVNELGEIMKPPPNSGLSNQQASRSTASYYTAAGSSSSADRAAGW